MNSGDRFWMSTAALLTYAMPLKKLEITGKTFTTRPELLSMAAKSPLPRYLTPMTRRVAPRRN